MRREASGSGSGFVILKDGFIVTNNHVIANAQRIQVSFAESVDPNTYTADVLSTVPEEDLALIKLRNPDGKIFPTVPMGTSSDLMIGEKVIARVVAALRDQGEGVFAQLVACRTDHVELFDRVGVEDSEDLVGPSRELLPVLTRCTEQLADDRNWIALADVGHDVSAPGRRHTVDQLADDLAHERAQTVGGGRRERLGDETAEPGVDVTFGGQDRGPRPAQEGLSSDEHFRWAQFRLIEPAPQEEWWYHGRGCGVWFKATRNPATNREEPGGE